MIIVLILHSFFLLIYINLIRSFICNTKRPSVKQSMKCKEVQNWQICQWTPCQLSIDALNTATPNLADLLADPPHQLSIDALNTATPNLADLRQTYPPSIEHRCLEYCYTELGRSASRPTPHQLSLDALNSATANLADLLADLQPPPAIEHRSLENHYTTYLADGPPQLSIELCKTITPHKFHI